MDSMVYMITIFFYIVAIVIAILFLLNLKNTIYAAAPENQAMRPNMVWLNIIPIVSVVYCFIVARKVSETIANEYRSKGQVLPNNKPTLATGMTLAILNLVMGIYGLYVQFFLSPASPSSSQMSPEEAQQYVADNSGLIIHSAIIMILFLVFFVFFIIYWVQTAKYKENMKMLPDNRAESQIFGQF